jgi:hypothetical protein
MLALKHSVEVHANRGQGSTTLDKIIPFVQCSADHPRSAQNGGYAGRRDRCSFRHRPFHPIPHHLHAGAMKT